MIAMRLLKKTALCASILTLAGCTAFSSFSEVEALNEAQPVGNPFTKTLTEEYRNFANIEGKEMFDYPDALHFARKGLASASGEMVLPEPLADWNLEADEIQTLAEARGRLIHAFNMGARELSPELSAKAQTRFDCWIEQQEESKENTQIACRSEFEDLMKQLESTIIEPPEPEAPEPEVVEAVSPEPMAFDVDPAEPMEAENAVYLVFFNWDSSKLESGAENVIEAVANEASQNTPEALDVIGHTDTSGDSAYNKRLAFKRANTVRDGLVNKGVDPKLIMIDAKGEEELLVSTPDNVREPANRRVNISFK